MKLWLQYSPSDSRTGREIWQFILNSGKLRVYKVELPPSGFQFDGILAFARAAKNFYKIAPLRRFQVILTQTL